MGVVMKNPLLIEMWHVYVKDKNLLPCSELMANLAWPVMSASVLKSESNKSEKRVDA
jgi:hypothetical protein